MMGSERVVGTRSDDGAGEVSGIVPQSLVELFGLLEERMGEAAGSEQGGSVETWSVRVGYLQVSLLMDADEGNRRVRRLGVKVPAAVDGHGQLPRR